MAMIRRDRPLDPGGGTMLGGAGNDSLVSATFRRYAHECTVGGDDVLGAKATTHIVTGDAGNDIAYFNVFQFAWTPTSPEQESIRMVGTVYRRSHRRQ